MHLTPQAQAVMLLTVSFGKSESQDGKPFSNSEWAKFAIWLKDHGLEPAVLLRGDLDSLLASWVDRTVSIARIRALLGRGAALGLALEKWQRAGLWVLTRSDQEYPERLKRRLRSESPAVLFGCGNKALLNTGGIAVVGSRDANEEDLSYTERLGAEAAAQGYSLVSGGARGVDQSAMIGALARQGTAVGVLADSLLRSATSSKYRKYIMSGDLALISPYNPEAGFNVGHAMSRNRYIYCLADAAVVISSTRDKGGTWNGAIEDIRAGWVPLWVKQSNDRNSGNRELAQRGANWFPEDMTSLSKLFGEAHFTPLQTLSDLAKEAVHANYALVECVKHGVAFHYSNIPTQLRRAIEAAVSSGEVDYLVCTSTLLQGVNLPAKNIFMFAPERGRTRALESTDFWNLAGRTGRLKREFQGNIFLIDYDKWKKKPLDGPKDSVVTPAIESSLSDHHDQLINVIAGAPTAVRSVETDLETTFVRLYTDFKGGALNQTFERAGLVAGDTQSGLLEAALASASEKLTLPAAVLRRTPNISAHKQQRLYDRLNAKIALCADVARTLIPSHPRESEAFQSYADVLELCHEIILGIDTSKNLHRFHALIARRWMLGHPLPQIIDDQISGNSSKPVRTTIRSTLDLIEGDIRFQAVRLFGCYSALLVYALDTAGLVDMVSSIPSLPLYLEIGASDKTMISFISLGLSRVTAMKLNEMSARKDLDAASALQWLRTRPLEALGLSPLLLAEVRAIAII